jgi:hypothetical protein
MNYKKILVTALIILSFSLCGCVYQVSDQDILAKPKLPLDFEEVRELLTDEYGDDLNLINPISGENTKAIQFIDLDSDGEDEVLIFRKVPSDKQPMKVVLLSKNEYGNWDINNDISGVGYDINKIEFFDFNLDGKTEIVIGWQGGANTNKGFSVYGYSEGKTKMIYQDNYTEFVIGDLTKDGIDDLLTIKLSRTDASAKATLHTYQNGKFAPVSTVNMDGYINNYYNVLYGKVSSDKYVVVVDTLIGSTYSFTDVIVYEDGKLNNVFFVEKWDITDSTYRYQDKKTADVDNDGVFEIPTLISPKGFEKTPSKDTPWITVWNMWDGAKGIIPKHRSYDDEKQGYRFIFSDTWDENVSVNIINSLTTFVVREENGSPLIPILDIQVLDVNEWDLNRDGYLEDGYFRIKGTLEKVYLGRIQNYPKDSFYSKYKMTKEDVITNFQILVD